jgi:hypothetical protein
MEDLKQLCDAIYNWANQSQDNFYWLVGISFAISVILFCSLWLLIRHIRAWRKRRKEKRELTITLLQSRLNSDGATFTWQRRELRALEPENEFVEVLIADAAEQYRLAVTRFRKGTGTPLLAAAHLDECIRIMALATSNAKASAQRNAAKQAL